VECRFLSNNGKLPGTSLADKLRHFGFEVRPSEVISSVDIVLAYLSQVSPRPRVLPLVAPELAKILQQSGYEIGDSDKADLVLIGVDRSLTGERMMMGLRACLRGAKIVATNADPFYPGEDGLQPGAGAYVGLFRGMGFEPERLCGKPDRWAVREALRLWGVSIHTECLFVGDNLATDIEAAYRIGADSALVLTGVTKLHDLEVAHAKPTHVAGSVTELLGGTAQR